MHPFTTGIIGGSSYLEPTDSVGSKRYRQPRNFELISVAELLHACAMVKDRASSTYIRAYNGKVLLGSWHWCWRASTLLGMARPQWI